MTDNKENDQNPKVVNSPQNDGPKGPHQNSKKEQERLQKRIEELRKRDPFIYR